MEQFMVGETAVLAKAIKHQELVGRQVLIVEGLRFGKSPNLGMGLYHTIEVDGTQYSAPPENLRPLPSNTPSTWNACIWKPAALRNA